MATVKEYLDYAELAQASYGDLVAGMFGKDNAQYINELTRKDSNGEINFSQTQATNFANRYKVSPEKRNFGSIFSARESHSS